MLASSEDDFPLWRKILLLFVVLFLLGPLLFSLFYSGLTRSTFVSVMSKFLILYGPIPWGIFLGLLILILGGYYIWKSRPNEN